MDLPTYPSPSRCRHDFVSLPASPLVFHRYQPTPLFPYHGVSVTYVWPLIEKATTKNVTFIPDYDCVLVFDPFLLCVCECVVCVCVPKVVCRILPLTWIRHHPPGSPSSLPLYMVHGSLSNAGGCHGARHALVGRTMYPPPRLPRYARNKQQTRPPPSLPPASPGVARVVSNYDLAANVPPFRIEPPLSPPFPGRTSVRAVLTHVRALAPTPPNGPARSVVPVSRCLGLSRALPAG